MPFRDPEKARQYRKQYYESNKERIKEQSRKYASCHRDQVNKRSHRYYKINKKKLIVQARQWAIAHPEARKVINSRAHRNRSQDTIIYDCVRRRILLLLDGNSKSASTQDLVGCSISVLKVHLQQTAEANGYLGFNIDDYSGTDYHIDHIKPGSLFHLEDPREQKRCFHYSNLQILRARENMSKSNNYPCPLS